MKTSISKTSFCIGIVTTLGLLLLRPLALSAQIQVAQESAAGAGDFDANILGTINPFVTALSTSEYYNHGWNHGGRFTYSFSPPLAEPQPFLVDNRAHLFAVATSDGLSVFHLFDDPTTGPGGTADTAYALSGGTAQILAYDDPRDDLGNGDLYTSDGTSFTADHFWAYNRTDGLAIGSLDGPDWSMFISFTAPPTGLSSWRAVSAEGNTLVLALATGRRVRLRGAVRARHRAIRWRRSSFMAALRLSLGARADQRVGIFARSNDLVRDSPSVQSDGTVNSFTVPTPAGNTFYRLRKP